MKTKIYLVSAVALLLGACSTGSYISKGYVDDIYFNPADIPPPVVLEDQPVQEDQVADGQNNRIIISEITDNEEGGKTMNNYIMDGEEAGDYADAQLYNMEQMELYDSDTAVYYNDDDVKYVINNYYDGEDIDFSYRIHRFHRPYSYFYDPFYWNDWYWDPWYYPYSSLSWGMGWGWNSWGYSPWYSGWYGGWYGGMYSSWYGPYSYWGYGGGWGYPYYASWYSPYSNNYWGGSYIDREDYRYGQRRDFNTTVAGGGGRNGQSRGGAALDSDRSPLKSSDPGRSAVTGRGTSVSGAANGGRPGREGSVTQGEGQSRTMTEMRRSGETTSGQGTRVSGASATRSAQSSSGNVTSSSGAASRRYSGAQQQYTRPATVSRETSQSRQSGTYVPSYNQQRASGRSSYNVQQGSRPSSSSSGTLKSTGRPVTVYSRPSSSTSSERSYRSGSTYSRSTSSGTNVNRSYSSPSQSSRSYSAPRSGSSSSYSSPSYSAPSRSSSSGSGSYGGGGSSSGGGSHSSGGGSSSHSGRR